MCRRLILLISFVLVLGPAGNARAELVAHYPFDDGTADDRAYSYQDADGTFFGDAKTIYDVDKGSVLDLDGAGDYVKILNNQVADFNTESFSYAFWAKTSFKGDWYCFWKGIDYAGDDGDDLHGANCYHDDDSTFVRFTVYAYTPATNKARAEVNDVNFISGDWIHVVCVRETPVHELRLYVNGKLEPPGPDGNPNKKDNVGDISNTGNLYIGANDRGGPKPTPTAFWNGQIDDFRVYNHALSEQEIRNLAAGGDPNLASEPGPPDGSTDECVPVVLSWTAGVNALTHDVYFGTNPYDLKDATTSDSQYRRNQEETAYDASSLETLVPGGTYYWRIDEIGASETWKGPIWKFRINDGKAHTPAPADGTTMVPLEQIVSWQAGCDAASHNVYFGTDFDDVSNGTAGTFQGNQALGDTDFDPCDWDPCGLDYGTYYYWRIDEVNGATTWEGNVWNFRTEMAIVDPNLRVWYKFDETEGITAGDSSGREYKGMAQGEGTWDPDGYYDGCFSLESNGNIIIPMGVLSEIDKGITISAWLNSAEKRLVNNVVCAAGWGENLPYVKVAVPAQEHHIEWRAGDTNDVMYWDRGSPAAWKGSWNYFAFVKDEVERKMQIYVNGLPVAEQTGVTDDTLAGVQDQRFRIGAETQSTEGYNGKIDDFRVYDRALSPSEIMAIFRGGDVTTAWGPTPFNGALDVPRDAHLAWNPGDFAVSHDVYLGTDWDDVSDATTLSSVYIRQQDPCEYDPPEVLDLSTTYYWRIDEVNDANDDSPWKGRVWTFTVANFLIVDDMESYNQTDNWIHDTWIDGYGNSSGAEVYVGFDPVHGGDQSMIYQYYNDGGFWGDLEYYAEAEVDISDLPIGPNWTEVGVKALTLFFDGNSTNDANEQMYVVLEDTAGNYAQVDYGYYPDEDINDIKKDEWQQWDIALSDFGDVTLTDIKKLYVGFGIRGNPNPGGTPGGSGFVYFDDIRLYLPKCVPWRLKPEADLTDDCKVDLADVGEMADQWLRTDLVFDAYTDPGTTGLVGWWKLDDGPGSTTAADDSIYNNTGTLEGRYTWTTGRVGPHALELDNGWVLVPDKTELRPQDAVSACAWVNYPYTHGYSARIVVKGADNKETFGLEVDGSDNLAFYVRDANNNRFDVSDDVWRKEWILLAGTFDSDSNTVSCYVNGQLVDSRDDVNFVSQGLTLSQDTNDLAIGNRSDDDDRQFQGTVDDVRVYDRALLAEEIAWLASDGTGYVPLTSQANLHDKEAVTQKAINFKDFAQLMNGWGEEKLWPPE